MLQQWQKNNGEWFWGGIVDFTSASALKIIQNSALHQSEKYFAYHRNLRKFVPF